MKIGIVCYPTYGGSGVVATELGKGLADKGHQVHFISYKLPARLDRFHENIFYHEVSVAEYPLFEYPPYDTALTSKLVDVIQYEKLDILHVHYAIPHATVAFLAKQICMTKGKYIPVITTLHGTDITLVGKNPAIKPVVEFSISQSDGVTAVSSYLRDTTYEHFDVKNDIKVIHNFIDLARFKKNDKDHFKRAVAPNGEKILIHISNFRKVKNVDDVVRIFKKVSDKVPSRLLLVGDGPERDNVERLCRELGLCEHIRFLGKQEHIEELLAIADVFIMPSGSESFGLAALEAMACEVPVISTDIGGLPELNIHGKTGYTSTLGDVDDMATNTLSIITDENKLALFRKEAYSQAQKFSLNSILPLYEKYYLETIERSKEIHS